MTGYQSKKKAALDEEGMYLVHHTQLAQVKVEGPLHVVCQCDKCKTESQEPVAWANSSDIISSKVNRERKGHGDTHTWSETKSDYHNAPLYTRPQPAAWVGLADEEISAIDWKSDETLHDFARAIEAKLKDKNI